MKKNIAVYIMGGVGNQLFQYLHALRLKSEGNVVNLLADWYVKPLPPETTLREFHLHRLPNLEIPVLFSSDLLERGCILSPYGYDDFDEKLVQFKAGYFQSASEFPLDETLMDFYSQIPVNEKFRNLTTMHIRLGDYVKLGWNLPIAYFESIFKANPNTQFIIFCENEAETVSFLSAIDYKNYKFAREIDSDLGGDPVLDFIAMGSSAFCYGSNSTFSYLAGLAVGFRGGSYICPNYQYWDWFDKDRLSNGKSLLDRGFITRKN